MLLVPLLFGSIVLYQKNGIILSNNFLVVLNGYRRFLSMPLVAISPLCFLEVHSAFIFFFA